MNTSVQKKFESYPEHLRPKMEYLRELILEVAASDDSIGELEETLKWGEPAYLTTRTKSGTTVRIDWKPKHPEQYAMYVHCQTKLIDTYRSLFPELTTEGDRAVIFDINQALPEDAVRLCIDMALKYHLTKNK